MVIGVLMVAGQAHAGDKVYTPWLPPAKYDHPYKGPGTLKVIRVPWYAIRSLCRAQPRMVVHACAFPTEYGCLVVMRDAGMLPTSHDRALFRHEQGHCNGWPRDHPRPKKGK